MSGLVVVGELTADGASIVLVANGPEHEMAQAAARMQTLTPLVKTTNPPGGLILPVSWAAVIQLARTLGPAWRTGPALSTWLAEQVRLRVAPPTELAVAPPQGLTPRSYQTAGACLIAATGRTLIFDEPRPQPITTPILTSAGWSTMGELQPGDVVFDLHGRPSRVRRIKHAGVQPVYRVTFSDRTSTLATGHHPWQVWTDNDRKRKHPHGRVLTTDQLAAWGLHKGDGGARFFLPQQPVVHGLGSGRELPLHPYAYGALLGDGALGGEHLSITCPDDCVLSNVERAVSTLGTTWRRKAQDGRCAATVFHRNGKLRAVLEQLDACTGAADKAVHPSYLHTDEFTRRYVLAGLLDTDGTVIRTGAGVEFSSASPRLAADVAWLARSLGAVVTESDPQPAGYRDAAGRRVECLPKHRVLIRFPADGVNPFMLPRKADAWAVAAVGVVRRQPPRTFQRIEPAGGSAVCCIELDTDDDHARVYLTDTALIPTHNTGKTVTAVLGLVERAAAGHPVLPVVVVCPAAVIDPWVEHVNRWTPWRAVAWRGTPRARRRLEGTAEVYVTSYDTCRRDAGETDRKAAPLMALGARFLVVDECHRIKDRSTEQSKAVRRLARRAAGFVGLSGTPITHSPGDLWPTLDAMEPGAWPSRERWVARYCDAVQGDYSSKVLGLNADREPEFRQALLGQYRRVARADVLDEMPKVHSVRAVDLPPEYRRAYDAMESDMLAELPDGGQLSAMGVLAKLTRLSQLASAAADVTTTTETVEVDGFLMERQHQHVTLKAPSWKVDELLVVMAERPDYAVACFAPSKQLITLAGQAAEKAGYRVGYVVGGQRPAERTAFVKAFQARELDLLCATTGAGGTGLTLSAADTLVFLQRPWSLVESLQAEDRGEGDESKRRGTEVIDVVARNTIDTRVRAVLRERAGQLADLVQDPRIVAELLGGAGVRDLRRAS